MFRSILLAFAALAISIPDLAEAYTSDGLDGPFLPSASVVLDSTHAVFNFTDFYIPSGVRVSFSNLAAGQPILILATGDIGIAGTLDAGGNSLWLQTPGAINLSGQLDGYSLSLYASSVNFSGTIASAVGSIGTSAGSTVTIGNGSSLCLAGACQPPVYSDNGSLTTGGGNIALCGAGCSLQLAPIPEASSAVQLLTGLGLVGLWARRRQAS